MGGGERERGRRERAASPSPRRGSSSRRGTSKGRETKTPSNPPAVVPSSSSSSSPLMELQRAMSGIVESNFRSAFDTIDSDKSGYIDANELYKFVSKYFHRHEYTMADVKKMLEDADENNDGMISYEEFCSVIKNVKENSMWSKTRSILQDWFLNVKQTTNHIGHMVEEQKEPLLKVSREHSYKRGEQDCATVALRIRAQISSLLILVVETIVFLTFYYLYAVFRYAKVCNSFHIGSLVSLTPFVSGIPQLEDSLTTTTKHECAEEFSGLQQVHVHLIPFFLVCTIFDMLFWVNGQNFAWWWFDLQMVHNRTLGNGESDQNKSFTFPIFFVYQFFYYMIVPPFFFPQFWLCFVGIEGAMLMLTKQTIMETLLNGKVIKIKKEKERKDKHKKIKI